MDPAIVDEVEVLPQIPNPDNQLDVNTYLFRLMCIVTDKHDHGFVEKTQLPQNEILSLCNKLVPASTSSYSSHPHPIRIDFDGLNKRCLHVVGFYGDKEMMTHIFRTGGLIDDSSVLARMEGDNFEAGLYAVVREEVSSVFVFYWHEGEQFKEASRKDVSCNFIRYLVELCNCIFVCVKGSFNFDAMAASPIRKPSKPLKFQLTAIENSTNDVDILPGFNVRINKELFPSGSTTASVVNSSNRVLFCEGYHHCCFLTEENKAPTGKEITTRESVKASQLGNLLKKWSLETNVDYSKLSNEQFINVLECCRPLEYEEYCKLNGSFKTSKSALNSAGLNLAMDKFVKESILNMSGDKKDDLDTLYIEEVVVKRQSLLPTPWTRLSHAEQVEIEYSIVQEHKLAVVWKACELTPMTKDVDELNSDSRRPVVPKCGNPIELVTINPQYESLFKAVLLRSGELMIFIHNFKNSCLHLYRCPRVGSSINDMSPIHTFRKKFDLLCLDELTRSMALYDKDQSKIGMYKFDGSFRNVYWTGVEVDLEMYSGSKIVRWMHIIPGRMELLLVDNTNRVRVLEISDKPMMRAKHFYFPDKEPLSKACISCDGFFLFVIRQTQASRGDDVGIPMEIYLLGDSMSYLKTIHLTSNLSRSMCGLEQLLVNVTNFGSQSHLVLYNPTDAPDFLSSYLLKTVLARKFVELQHVQKKVPQGERKEAEINGSCPWLDFVYHIFDKFGTTPTLFPQDKRSITFKVVLESTTNHCNEEASIRYFEALLHKVKAAKEKDFTNFQIDFQQEDIEQLAAKFGSRVSADEETKTNMGEWVHKLICLVPIQIARAENNGVVALNAGLQIPHYFSCANSVSLANSICFGLYDAVLHNWKGKIKVISSMGKQSSGKSYLLNHLSGSLLDVAGGRCTDGVWMTVRGYGPGYGNSRCLYVLLDFEGLGSFGRTEQEDILLSLLNAAVSNLTIFNEKDFHLDKDTEAIFGRLQNVMKFLKQDNKLFKGEFCIAIKDVDRFDVEDLLREFETKISKICSKSEENFISKMYDGKLEIVSMSPLHQSDYYQDSLRQLAQIAYRKDSCYDNGSAFLRDLKLIIAQIATKDWATVDRRRVALIVEILRRNLKAAVSMGCLSVAMNKEVQMLVNFDTLEEIPDLPVAVGDFSSDLIDSGMYLPSPKDISISVTARDVLSQLKSRLETIFPRKGSGGDLWHSMFEKFLEALAKRRHDRVQMWISSNTVDFCDDDEVKRLQLRADVALTEVKQGLSVCGRKCSVCFYRCVLEKGHDQSDSEHSCMGSHLCTESCSFCPGEGGEKEEFHCLRKCRDLAGHEGFHDCRERNHACGATCALFEMFSYCNQMCSLKPEHFGKHMCNSPQHMCKMTCSHPSCNNPCAVAIKSNHEKHQCHERYCQSKCSIEGCNKTCAVPYHFHGVDDPNAQHLCGNEHACPEKCQMPGICEISTELVRQTHGYEGQRGSLVYEHVSEQIELRKHCCIPIPPFQTNHQGPHVHSKNEDSLHSCNTRCEGCGYFCQLPINHPGLHDTVHGNMRNVRFILEEEDTNHQNQMHGYGENAKVEICNMYCRKQGRGHTHLVLCPGSIKCTSYLYNGSRHQTMKYGRDVDAPKDEMTHKTYWQHLGFVDPCTQEEGKEYGLCNHYCNSVDHEADGEFSKKSYCTKKLWHQFITETAHSINSFGYITADTHHFPCHHPKRVPHHVIFVIDKSASMGKSDITPTMAKFMEHNNRLGCAYEAILRFIQTRLRTVSSDSVSVVLFDKSSTVAVEIQDMKDNVVDSLLEYHAASFINWNPTLKVSSDVALVGLQVALVVGLGQVHYILPALRIVSSILKDASKIPGWGTCYCFGLKAADQLMKKASTDSRVDKKIPTIIFLSDGGNPGKLDPVSYLKNMKRQNPVMELHTILYGKTSAKSILQAMAKAGNGKFYLTQNELQLATCFENLAKSLGSKDLTGQ